MIRFDTTTIISYCRFWNQHICVTEPYIRRITGAAGGNVSAGRAGIGRIGRADRDGRDAALELARGLLGRCRGDGTGHPAAGGADRARRAQSRLASYSMR